MTIGSCSLLHLYTASKTPHSSTMRAFKRPVAHQFSMFALHFFAGFDSMLLWLNGDGVMVMVMLMVLVLVVVMVLVLVLVPGVRIVSVYVAV